MYPLKNKANAVSQTARNKKANKKHIVFVYETRSERQRFLADYFGEALAANCLCIFVSSDSEEKIVEDFKAQGLDIREALRAGAFRTYDMHETYLPHGDFAAEFMIQNVTQFIENAQSLGYAGVYTAGEMTWLRDNPQFQKAAYFYEGKVNELQKHYPDFTALCLYPTGTSPLIDDAMKTHPLCVFNGDVVPNRHYEAAA